MALLRQTIEEFNEKLKLIYIVSTQNQKTDFLVEITKNVNKWQKYKPKQLFQYHHALS